VRPLRPLRAGPFGVRDGTRRRVVSFYQLQFNENYHFWETFHLTSEHSHLTHSVLQNKTENFPTKSKKKIIRKGKLFAQFACT